MQQLKQKLQVTLARMRKKQRNQQHELEKVLDEVIFLGKLIYNLESEPKV